MSEAAPLSFSPQGGSLSCSAFSGSFKALAVLLVSLAFIWGWRMWAHGLLEPTWQSSGWLLAALGLMAYTEWHILRGKTTLNSETIKQSWMWDKQVALHDLAFAKLFRVRGLDWLIAPRLYTKTFSGKMAAFYAADPAMLAEFKRLAQALDERHKQR